MKFLIGSVLGDNKPKYIYEVEADDFEEAFNVYESMLFESHDNDPDIEDYESMMLSCNENNFDEIKNRYNVGKCTGDTTRKVDQLIQELFNNRGNLIAMISDKKNLKDAMNDLIEIRNRAIFRLKNEHGVKLDPNDCKMQTEQNNGHLVMTLKIN